MISLYFVMTKKSNKFNFPTYIFAKLYFLKAAHLVPHSLKYEEAVSLPVAYGSAYLALKKAGVKEGLGCLLLSYWGYHC